jgi:ribosomal protein S27E
MSWNKTSYVCKCGECNECLSRAAEKAIYPKRPLPPHVAERLSQKRASEEEAARSCGYVVVNCPKCHRDRMVYKDTLQDFSCDKCGFRVNPQ